MCLRLKKVSPKILDGTVYILATSTAFTCLNYCVLSVSNTVLFMYIDRNLLERPYSSIFIVCVTLPLNMVWQPGKNNVNMPCVW